MSKSRPGNGELCPVNPEHGRMYVEPNDRQYCPHVAHDRDRTPAIYESDGKTPAARRLPNR